MSRSRSQIGGCNRKTGESRCEQFKGTSTTPSPVDQSKLRVDVSNSRELPRTSFLWIGVNVSKQFKGISTKIPSHSYSRSFIDQLTRTFSCALLVLVLRA